MATKKQQQHEKRAERESAKECSLATRLLPATCCQATNNASRFVFVLLLVKVSCGGVTTAARGQAGGGGGGFIVLEIIYNLYITCCCLTLSNVGSGASCRQQLSLIAVDFPAPRGKRLLLFFLTATSTSTATATQLQRQHMRRLFYITWRMPLNLCCAAICARHLPFAYCLCNMHFSLSLNERMNVWILGNCLNCLSHCSPSSPVGLSFGVQNGAYVNVSGCVKIINARHKPARFCVFSGLNSWLFLGLIGFFVFHLSPAVASVVVVVAFGKSN